MSRIDMKSLKEKSFQNSKEMKKLKKYDFYYILLWKKGKDIYEEKILCLYKENTYKKYKNIYYECFDNNDGFYDEEYVINNPNNYEKRNNYYGDCNKKFLENDYLIKFKYSTKKNGLLHCIDNDNVYSLYKEKFIKEFDEDDYDEYLYEYHEDDLLNNLYGYSKKLDVYPCYGGWNGPHYEKYYIKGIEYSKEEYDKIRDDIIKEKKDLLINKLNSSNIYYRGLLKILSDYFY